MRERAFLAAEQRAKYTRIGAFPPPAGAAAAWKRRTVSSVRSSCFGDVAAYRAAFSISPASINASNFSASVVGTFLGGGAFLGGEPSAAGSSAAPPPAPPNMLIVGMLIVGRLATGRPTEFRLGSLASDGGTIDEVAVEICSFIDDVAVDSCFSAWSSVAEMFLPTLTGLSMSPSPESDGIDGVVARVSAARFCTDVSSAVAAVAAAENQPHGDAAAAAAGGAAAAGIVRLWLQAWLALVVRWWPAAGAAAGGAASSARREALTRSQQIRRPARRPARRWRLRSREKSAKSGSAAS